MLTHAKNMYHYQRQINNVQQERCIKNEYQYLNKFGLPISVEPP